MPAGLVVLIILGAVAAASATGILVYLVVGGANSGTGGTPSPGANVTVTGHVLAGANQAVPVGNAVVHVENSSGVIAQIITGPSGSYELRARRGATYTFWATLGVHWGLATGPETVRTMPLTAPTVNLDLAVPASDISGTVIDRSTGLAITGATISIADPSGDWWCCQITGASGAYLLWTITPGPYNVSAAASGYTTAYTMVFIPSMYSSELHVFSLGTGPAALGVLRGATVLATAGMMASADPPLPMRHLPTENHVAWAMPSSAPAVGGILRLREASAEREPAA